jgi:hypothetical protein
LSTSASRPSARSQGLGDDLLDLGIGDLARLSRPRLVQQPIKPELTKAPPPRADRVAMHTQALSDLRIALAGRRRKHDPRPHRRRVSRLLATRPPLQHLTLLNTQLDLHSSRTRHHHILQQHNN